MKTWLTKFRISNTLDTGKPWPPAVQRAVAQSEELRHFAENAAALHQALKNSQPEPTVSASLHTSIMRAVRTAESSPVFSWQDSWPRLIAAPTLALLVLLGVAAAIHFSRPPGAGSGHSESSSLAAASSALDLGGKLVREMPDAALSPLSEEMQRLNLDLASAQKFLLASLP